MFVLYEQVFNRNQEPGSIGKKLDILDNLAGEQGNGRLINCEASVKRDGAAEAIFRRLL